MSNCLNFSESGCLVLTTSTCPTNCSSRIEDPMALAKSIREMMDYIPNSKDKKRMASLRKELKDLVKKYSLPLWVLDESLPLQKMINLGAMNDWYSVYKEDLKRGTGGGSSEGSNPVPKAIMNDNRAQETKPTASMRREYNSVLAEWEAEHGKLEKLARSSVSRSKINSYTGEAQ